MFADKKTYSSNYHVEVVSGNQEILKNYPVNNEFRHVQITQSNAFTYFSPFLFSSVEMLLYFYKTISIK